MIVHVDVMENGEKKETAENPGGLKLMADLGGEKSGLPFFAVLDANGKKLADSNVAPGGKNIGYPATAEEIAAFVKVLKTTAPQIRPDQLDRIEKDLMERSPERARRQ